MPCYHVDPDDHPGSDDASRIQAAVDSVPWTIDDPLVLNLSRRYLIDQTVRIAPKTKPEGKPLGKVIVEGCGAELWWRGTQGPVLQLGDASTRARLYWSQVRGLRIDKNQNSARVVGLLVDSAEWLTLVDCNGSGGSIGVHCPGGTVEGVARGVEYLRIQDCTFGGVDTAADIDGNVVTINNTQFQAATVGLRYSGTTLDATGIDLSNCTEAGVELVRSGNVVLHGYSEKMGVAGGGGNSAVVRAIDSTTVQLSMVLNATLGAAWCLDLDKTRGVDIRGGTLLNPHVGGVRLQNGCEDIVMRRIVRWRPRTTEPLVTGEVQQWYRE